MLYKLIGESDDKSGKNGSTMRNNDGGGKEKSIKQISLLVNIIASGRFRI